MKLIERPRYLQAIENRLHRNMVVCLTGQRRVGKSCLLRTLAQKLRERGGNVVFIDKEKAEFDHIANYTQLNAHIDSLLRDGADNYVLIDEVQDVEGFEKTLCNYYDRDGVQLVVTGSNARLFSGELATLIAGRCLTVHVGSLTYREFLAFHGMDDSDTTLRTYLNIGGMPNLRLLPHDDPDAAQDYLHSIYNTIVLKDIVQREKIRNLPFLENLARFVADSIGKLFSPNSIAKYMTHERESVSPEMVKNYMRTLTAAFLIDKVARWDIHGKQLLSVNEKYYFEDLGLRNILTSANRAFDIEKLLENAVYLHLRATGWQVNVGALRGGEIDFVARRNTERVYVQVTYLVATQETYDREFGNLRKINDNYPKYVVSMDPLIAAASDDGIHHVTLREFLMSE